jgi:hypothetical protein
MKLPLNAAEGSAGGQPTPPLQQAYLLALARRCAHRSAAAQRALQRRGGRLQSEGLDRAVPAETAAASSTVPSSTMASTGPLSALLQHIARLQCTAASGAAGDYDPDTTGAALGPGNGLRSLRQAGPTWAHLRVQQQLQLSLDKAPDQAGPLNSHGLVLRTLQTLQALSPDYLLRFMAQVDTLFALDHAQAVLARPTEAGKPARRDAAAARRRAGRG